MTQVDSTSIASAGYSPETRELYICFLQNGKTYIYEDVEDTVFAELMSAESKGAFVNRHIKDCYAYRENEYVGNCPYS